jgi:cellulose biosynthesis protein BcsQ
VKSIAFFNNKGGVGKTSLVYHVACMLASQGFRVLAVDLDPQANLTGMFVDEDRLEGIMDDSAVTTIYGCVEPFMEGTGDIREPDIEEVASESGDVGLVLGDLALSRFEDKLADAWPRTLSESDRASLRVMTAFGRIVRSAAKSYRADVALIDVGPNLGSINRAALIAADHVVIPLAPDLFSLQGLRNLGPTLRHWRREWALRVQRHPHSSFEIPSGDMQPIGYVVLQHAMRLDRPVKAYAKWMARIPEWYARWLLETAAEYADDPRHDPHCLGLLKNYRSLMPLAQEARKPMFALRVADGALGAQQAAVAQCREDFERLVERIKTTIALDERTS